MYSWVCARIRVCCVRYEFGCDVVTGCLRGCSSLLACCVRILGAIWVCYGFLAVCDSVLLCLKAGFLCCCWYGLVFCDFFVVIHVCCLGFYITVFGVRVC